MFIILFILVFGIPLYREWSADQRYREECRRRGDEIYWSRTGQRYTKDDKPVYK